jgi:serine/threonine protein kinase/WD40 repeat protein
MVGEHARMRCFTRPDFEQLLAGQLTDEKQSQIDDHLVDCEHCREQLGLISEDDELAVRIMTGLAPSWDSDGSIALGRSEITSLRAKPSTAESSRAAPLHDGPDHAQFFSTSAEHIETDSEFLRRLSVELPLSQGLDDDAADPAEGSPTAGRHRRQQDADSGDGNGFPQSSDRESPTFPVRFPAIEGLVFERVLGEGGMGIVFKAYDEQLRRPVAVKLLRNAANSADFAVRLRREAEASARLNHPNVVQVYSVGESDGMPYVVMEYVNGGTLSARLQSHPQPPRAAARVVRLLAEAVEFAHQRAVIHRDLKPRNILLECRGPNLETAAWDEIVPKVADFGLAKLQDQNNDATRTGQLLGTPAYAAPEQLQMARPVLARHDDLGAADQEATATNSPVGPAADIYSLGVLLYQMLTGRPPLQAEDLLRTIKLVLDVEPLPPQRLQPGIPRDLQTICLRCLAKEPHHRYASAAALADDLRRFLDGEPILAKPPSLLGRLMRWSLRNRLLAGMEAVAAMLFTSLVVSAIAGLLILNKKNSELEESNAKLDASSRNYQKLYSANERALKETRDANALALKQKELADAAASVARQEKVRADNAAKSAVDLAAQANQFAGKAAKENYLSLIAAANLSLQYSESRLRRDYLTSCIPGPGEPDRRGWEWHYLHGIRGGELFFWDVASVLAHPWTPCQLVFSPDGRWLAMAARQGFGTDSGVVLLWDAPAMRFVRKGEFAGTPNWQGIDFSEDGTRLVVIGSQLQPLGSWRLADWAADVGQSQPPLKRRYGFALQAILNSPQPTKLGIVHPTDLAPSSTFRLFEHAMATAGTVRDDGAIAATAGADGKIEIWRTQTGQRLQQLLSETRPILAIALNPIAPLAVTIAHDRKLRLWDLSCPDSRIPVRVSPIVSHFRGATPLPAMPTTESTASAPVVAPTKIQPNCPLPATRPELIDFAFSDDESSLERVRFAPGSGVILDKARIETGETQRLRWLGTAAAPRGIRDHTCLNTDGSRFALPLINPPSFLAVGDSSTGEITARIVQTGGSFERHWISPDGKWLATLNEGQLNVKLWDVSTGKEFQTIPPPAVAATAAYERPIVSFDSGNKRLAVHYGPAGVSLLAFPDGTRHDGIAAGLAGPPARCAFDQRGVWLAIPPSGDRLVLLVDISNPAKIPPPEFVSASGTGRQLDVVAMEFSPDKQRPRLATVSREGDVYLWSPDDRRLILRLTATRTSLDDSWRFQSQIRWSRTGRKLAVDRANGTIDVWDAPDTETVAELDRNSILTIDSTAASPAPNPPAPAHGSGLETSRTTAAASSDQVAKVLRAVATRGLLSELQSLGHFSEILYPSGAEEVRIHQAEHLRLALDLSRLIGDLSPWVRSDMGFVFAARGEWKLAADAWWPPADHAVPRTPESYERAYLTARRILASDVPIAEVRKHCPQFLELELEQLRYDAKNNPQAWRAGLEKRLESDPCDAVAARDLAELLLDELPPSPAEAVFEARMIFADPRNSPFAMLAAAWIAHKNMTAASKTLDNAPPSASELDRQIRERLRKQITP